MADHIYSMIEYIILSPSTSYYGLQKPLSSPVTVRRASTSAYMLAQWYNPSLCRIVYNILHLDDKNPRSKTLKRNITAVGTSSSVASLPSTRKVHGLGHGPSNGNQSRTDILFGWRNMAGRRPSHLLLGHHSLPWLAPKLT